MISIQAWRRSLEAIVIPAGAVLLALLIFGLFCALAGAR